MTQNEQRAFELREEAEQMLASSKSPFFFIASDIDKRYESLEMFGRAGNLFKLAKNWEEAGRTFVRLAQLHAKYKHELDATMSYVEASNCYKKICPKKAAECLSMAITYYVDRGKLNIAARHHKAIAELYEKSEAAKAMEHYNLAAECYRSDESRAAANKCYLKVAEFAAQLKDYEKAIRLFEEISTAAMDSSLRRYSTTEYFFRACLCHLCIDFLNAEQALQRYQDLYPPLEDSREAKLIKALSKNIEEDDVDSFDEELNRYNRVLRLDPWHMTMIQRVRSSLTPEDDLT